MLKDSSRSSRDAVAAFESETEPGFRAVQQNDAAGIAQQIGWDTFVRFLLQGLKAGG